MSYTSSGDLKGVALRGRLRLAITKAKYERTLKTNKTDKNLRKNQTAKNTKNDV